MSTATPANDAYHGRSLWGSETDSGTTAAGLATELFRRRTASLAFSAGSSGVGMGWTFDGFAPPATWTTGGRWAMNVSERAFVLL